MVVRWLHFHCTGDRVPSLVKELRSYKTCSRILHCFPPQKLFHSVGSLSFFLAAPGSLWDLSSLIRDLSSESAES